MKKLKFLISIISLMILYSCQNDQQKIVNEHEILVLKYCEMELKSKQLECDYKTASFNTDKLRTDKLLKTYDSLLNETNILKASIDENYPAADIGPLDKLKIEQLIFDFEKNHKAELNELKEKNAVLYSKERERLELEANIMAQRMADSVAKEIEKNYSIGH
jgi:hypothetical protein